MVPPTGDERLGEQADRLYGLYERKASAFRTALISVMSLITIILALVFYPYVTLRGERYALQAALDKKGHALARAEGDSAETLKQLQRYVEGMQNDLSRMYKFSEYGLQTATAEHVKVLESIIQGLAGDPEVEDWLARAKAGEKPPSDLRKRHSELRKGWGKPCFWLQGEVWQRCALKEALPELDISVVKQLKYGHAPELRLRLFGDLVSAALALRRSFATYLLSDETTWQLDAAAIAAGMSDRHPVHLAIVSDNWTKQLEIRGTLKQQTVRYVDLYAELMKGHERYVEESLSDMNKDVRVLGKEKARIEGELEVVVSKLEGLKGLQNIETPFGTLPVGINELVLLFPVLVAAGFMLMVSLFVESLELRHEYRLLIRLTDPDGTVLPDRRIALIAPLWVDSLKPPSHRIYRTVILGLPVLAFVGTIWLLAWNQLLTGPFIKEARLNDVIYFGLYIASALTILEGSRRTVRALRRQAVKEQSQAVPQDAEPDHDDP